MDEISGQGQCGDEDGGRVRDVIVARKRKAYRYGPRVAGHGCLLGESTAREKGSKAGLDAAIVIYLLKLPPGCVRQRLE